MNTQWIPNPTTHHQILYGTHDTMHTLLPLKLPTLLLLQLITDGEKTAVGEMTAAEMAAEEISQSGLCCD